MNFAFTVTKEIVLEEIRPMKLRFKWVGKSVSIIFQCFKLLIHDTTAQ